MSNFIQIAEEMIDKMKYEEWCQNGIGKITIHGLSFPENKDFSPLDKIWSSVRKRNAETYNVYTTAIFRQAEDGTIKGEFYPNHATVDEQNSHQYIRHFENTFCLQILLFIDAINSFLMDYQLGYVAYCNYLQQTDEISSEKCGAMLDAFLRQYHFKTDEDDAEKSRREELSKQILAVKEYVTPITPEEYAAYIARF